MNSSTPATDGAGPGSGEQGTATRSTAGRATPLSPQERQVEVAAARLRVTLDRRLNRKTPTAIVALAQEEL